VSDARSAEAALRESEQKFRTVADHTYAWEFWLSPEGRFLYNSPSCKRITGYDADLFVTDPELFDRIIHPDDRKLYEDHRGRGGEACATEEVEFRIVRADGEVRWIAHACVPVYDDQGVFLGVRGSNRDITDAKRAEAALRRSEERLRATFDNAGVGIVETADDDRFIAANDRACRILGRSREQLLGMSVHELTWPEDRALSDRLNADLHEATRERLDYEKRYLKGDGSPVWVHVTITPIRDKTGHWLRAIATVEDISKRKAAEEALRESELFYRQTLESIPGMVFTTRPDGYCDYQSERWVEFTGVPMSEHLGDGWNKLLHPEDRPRAYAAWRAAVEERGEYDLEYRVRRHDGEYRWFKVRGRPIRDAQGRIVRWFGTALEIEDLKRAQEQLAAARLSAERAKAAAEEANAAKDHFLAVLSHELRTPLTPVVASISMLQKNPWLDPNIQRDLEMIRRNVELEARLIDDLLDITRITRGKVELNKQPVELCTVLNRAVEVCRPDIEARQLHFGVDIGPDGPYLVQADVARLQQVFWNLLKNSIKFTPHGGCVGIRCRVDENHVVAEVNDSGVGIDSEALPRIFDAFTQADRAITRQFGGLGLGLAISKSLVEMHGGTIEAHSDGPGKGASFRIRLPLIAATTAASGAPAQHLAESTPSRQRRSLRLLVVEDHGDTSDMMRLMLESEGHRVDTAGDLQTAVDKATQNEFDMLISDLGLPDGSGLDLMKELRARGYKLPGIALSGYGQDSDIQQSRQAGFSMHVTKPVDMDRLLAALEAVWLRGV
jgi:PAS domain S-box-containing protein